MRSRSRVAIAGLCFVLAHGCGGEGSEPGDDDGGDSTVASSSGQADGAETTEGGVEGSADGGPDGGPDGDPEGGAEDGVDDGPCFVDCQSELQFLLPEGTGEFTLSLLSGGGFEGTVSCPSGEVSGWFSTPGTSAACAPDAVTISTMGYTFADTISIAIDDGEPQEFQPEYTWIESCEMDACNTATVEVGG